MSHKKSPHKKEMSMKAESAKKDVKAAMKEKEVPKKKSK